MSASDFSKRMIAEGMMNLLMKENLEDISIGRLAQFCGVSRSTVYYHFKDKYDIISWIFRSEIAQILDASQEVGQWTDNLLKLCLYLQKNREFYVKILRENGQNSFCEYLTQYCNELILQMFRESHGDRVLQLRQIQTISLLYSHGIMGLIQQWGRNNMEEDPEPLVKTVKDLISGAVFDQMLSMAQK